MLILVGTNHKNSPISVREKISFSRKHLGKALDFLRAMGSFRGGVILSTCNRVEIYVDAEESQKGISQIKDFISRYKEIDMRHLDRHLYIYLGEEALKHLFTVASGLDSQILGERQIQEQLEAAVSESEKANFLSGFLRCVFYRALSLAKKIHEETDISKAGISIGSVAVSFLKERLGASLWNKKILIVGLGKVSELLIDRLKELGRNVILISSKNFERAKALAETIGAEAAGFSALEESLNAADIVITATQSPHRIIKKDMVKNLNREIVLLDLAMPRNIDPDIVSVDGVKLYDLEDLNDVIKIDKIKSAEDAARIIDREIENRWHELIESEQEEALLR